MANDNRPAEISPVDIRREERGDGAAQGRKLARADEVEEEEDSEDEGERKADEAGVYEDGGEQHGDHHTVEDFAAGVDLDDRGEAEDNGEAEEDDADTVGTEKEADVCGSEGDLAEGFEGAEGLGPLWFVGVEERGECDPPA